MTVRTYGYIWYSRRPSCKVSVSADLVMEATDAERRMTHYVAVEASNTAAMQRDTRRAIRNAGLSYPLHWSSTRRPAIASVRND